MKLELPDDFVNELQRRSIIKLIDAAKRANSTDIHMRISGKFVMIEADWIKHLKFVETD